MAGLKIRRISTFVEENATGRVNFEEPGLTQDLHVKNISPTVQGRQNPQMHTVDSRVHNLHHVFVCLQG